MSPELFSRLVGPQFPSALVAAVSPAAMGPGWVATSAGQFTVAVAWADVYHAAYEQARAALAPSRLQRMLEPCWN